MNSEHNNFGKLPPQNLDIEEAVLGQLLLVSDSYYRVANIINNSCFYKNKNNIVYSAIIDVHRQHGKIDMLLIANHLKEKKQLDEVGGAYYIASLTNRVTSTVHIEHHAIILRELANKRELITRCSEALNNLYRDDIDYTEVSNVLTNSIIELNNIEQSSIKTVNDGCVSIMSNIEKILKSPESTTGIKTGYTEFDNRTGGLNKGDLIIIAAENSMGKTSFALNIVNNASKINPNIKVAIYSLEMMLEHITAKLLSLNSDISSNTMLYHPLSNYQLDKVGNAIVKVRDRKIYIDEKSTSNLDTMLSSIRMMVLRYQIDFVVIDYLQLITVTDKGLNDELKMAKIARSLKNIAKELKIPVILLSQFSRDKNDPKPRLSRMRGSGQIEEAIDIAICLYNPSARNLPTFGAYSEYEHIDSGGKILVDIQKGRMYGIWKFFLNWNNTIGLMTNINEEIEEMKPNTNLDEF